MTVIYEHGIVLNCCSRAHSHTRTYTLSQQPFFQVSWVSWIP